MPQHRKTRVVANLELCARPGGRVSANEEGRRAQRSRQIGRNSAQVGSPKTGAAVSRLFVSATCLIGPEGTKALFRWNVYHSRRCHAKLLVQRLAWAREARSFGARSAQAHESRQRWGQREPGSGWPSRHTTRLQTGHAQFLALGAPAERFGRASRAMPSRL